MNSINDIKVSRRDFIKTSLLAATAITGVCSESSLAEEKSYPFTVGTQPPKSSVPVNACDSHIHIYDDRFTLAAGVKSTPMNSTVTDYLRFQKRMGTTRTVAVMPSAYGTDNSSLLEALEKLGKNARGIAVFDTSVTDSELKRLYDRGVRGVRINVPPRIATTIEMIEPLSRRLEPFGMHVQVHMTADDLVKLQEVLLRLPSALVIDHFGRIPQPLGMEHPAYAVICKLLDKGNTWVKVSGADQDTKTGAPSYSDVGKLAIAYVKRAPERILWGTGWPHIGLKLPDDALLFDLLEEWAPDQKTRQRILVSNPEALFGFPAV